MAEVVVALVHHPVLDRQKAVVTTAITNLDIHDMSRSAVTYAASALYLIHPITAQRELAERIKSHWVEGSGKKRIPDRATALEIVRISDSLETMYTDLGGRGAVEAWTTAASSGRGGPTTTYSDARKRLEASEKTVVLLFGTGWGLAPELLDDADVRIEPIRGAPGSVYNHLSVRAACAITLDRLRG